MILDVLGRVEARVHKSSAGDPTPARDADSHGIPFGGALLVSLGIATIPGAALAEILALAGVTPSKAIRAVTGVDLDTAVSLGAKPALQARAELLGAIARNYDLCCLCEVFTDASRDAVMHSLAADPGGVPFAARAGQDAGGEWTLAGSGLYFLARRTWPVVKSETLVYGNRGVRNGVHTAASDAFHGRGCAR